MPGRARSRRRRECGVTASAVNHVIQGAGTGVGTDGHTHANKDLLDALSVVAGYLLAGGAKISAGLADEAGHAASARTLDADSPMMSQFLRKDVADTAEALITFAAGLVSKGDVVTEAGLSVGGDANITGDIEGNNLTAQQQVSGATVLVRTLLQLGQGTGWHIDNLGQAVLNTLTLAGLLAGKDATFETLTVTKGAHFFEVIIDRLRSQQGAVIITAANGKVDAVEENGSFHGYDLYFRASDGDGRAITASWRVGDGLICQTFNAASGSSYAASNRYYWMRVLEVSSAPVTRADGNAYHRVTVSSEQGYMDPSSNATPAAGDEVTQLGYDATVDSNPLTGKALAARQGAIVLSAYPIPDTELVPSLIATYRGIDDFTLSPHRATYIDAETARFIGNLIVKASATDAGTDINTYVTNIAETKSAAAALVVQQGLDAQIRAEVTRASGAETRIEAKADGLTSRVTDAEGNISELQQTAEEIHMGLRGNGEAGTNLLTLPDLTQANVQAAWTLMDSTGSANVAYLTETGQDGIEEHMLDVDQSDIQPTSGQAFSVSQMITSVIEPGGTYVVSAYVRNTGYSASAATQMALLIESGYWAVTPAGGENPAQEEWYERSGNSYVLSQDTLVVEGKTYYAKAAVEFVSAGYTGSNVQMSTDRTDGVTWTRQLYSIADTEWHRVWLVFSVPDMVPQSLRFVMRLHIASNQYGSHWQMELPKLELGTRPTAWSAMSDALKRTGIDITRGKIRLDADTVEVAKDLTIGGHTRIGGWIYNEVNEISGNNATDMSMGAFNVFCRSDVMNKWMTGDTSYDADFVDGHPVNNEDVIRFPECGANLLWSSDDLGELVLPFYAALVPATTQNPYVLKDYDTISTYAWAESSYDYLNSLLKDPFGTALPYVGSRMLIRHTGGDSLYLYGVKGFGRVYRGFSDSYSAMIMEYDPWGYYTHVWHITELTDTIHGTPLNATYATRSMLMEAVEQVRGTFLNWDGSRRSYYSTALTEISNGVSMKVALDIYEGTSPMTMEGGEYVELRCTMADGEIYWEIQDNGTI